MNVEIKKLDLKDTDEFVDLIKIFAVVFEMDDLKMPDNEYLRSLLAKPDFFVLIAQCDGKVIGGLTVYILHRYYSAKPVAYIYDVGVMPDYQRNGTGKKLISHLNKYCKDNNFEDAYVEAETNDTQAVNFYRTTPISSELQATHFTYTFDNN
ncbi:GNAT family N-acetyltransferase [Catalinimonas niigatensis]|uniref:GNAT family N-acetyltransferase n=1 Tax=Catalinimonas niigatensis TaxID=1397264 RepID=UPI0026659628|nr:GNAT family N-acetyltransferase [Catalinimonas niigatensis]WPP51381.1 GNAT family N-acetyltransferase [Catalinimonas niigatensis]